MVTTHECTALGALSSSGSLALATLTPASSERARLATSLLTDSLGQCVSVQDVAQASGLSVRTLYRVVQRNTGTSPVALRRRARLVAARGELLAPGPETTVTAVALRWGFVHLGRFPQDYRRAFGEAPSQTLRLAREGRAPAAGLSRSM